MNHTPVIHDTFTIERVLDAPVARVFEALANPEVKAQWFAGPSSWTQVERSFDFRVGGRERLGGSFEAGMTSLFEAGYLDIVLNERVVYVYEMLVNGRKISTSLATWELFSQGTKTRLVLTEQGAYFHDPEMKRYAPGGQAKSRVSGTEALMDKFAAIFSH